jgi:hypothetical protein
MSLLIERNRKTSYQRPVRWSLLAACLLGLGLGLAGGCFHPDVMNGGFACSQTDDPPCPSGFSCVSGLCQDHPGAGGGDVDLATGTGGNGGGGGGGAGGGTTSADMAHPSQDLSSSDMAQAPMCGAQGAACSGNGDCCMMVCFIGVCVI